jgi:hypothetical protein
VNFGCLRASFAVLRIAIFVWLPQPLMAGGKAEDEMATTARFGRRRASSGRRLRLQHISTVAGLALALALAATVARSESKPARAPLASVQSSSPTWHWQPTPNQPEQIAYYLVTSEEDAARVRSWAWYEHALLGGEPAYRRTIFVPILSACGSDSLSQAVSSLAADATYTSVRVLVADVC